MTKTKPSADALALFHSQLGVATLQYAKFWREFFEGYGFKVSPTKHTYDPNGTFEMEYNGEEVSCYCRPSAFQGLKLRFYNKATTDYQNIKIQSESGAIKFMRQNNLGTPK